MLLVSDDIVGVIWCVMVFGVKLVVVFKLVVEVSMLL